MNASIYIPCYNAAAYLDEVLPAVLRQTVKPEEVLVVDDGSTDNSAAIAAQYPVRIIRHERNLGLAAARNTAWRGLRAEYIASVDADCAPAPDWLECLLKKMRAESFAAAGGRLVEKRTDSVCDCWRGAHMEQQWGERECGPEFLFGSNTVFRRGALQEIGGYNEEYTRNYEDVDLCARLKNKNHRFCYLPQAIVHHLRRDNLHSLLEGYWQWRQAYYRQRRFYENTEAFAAKIRDNIGLANRYFEEDSRFGREDLLYIDFLLALHHSFKDWTCFRRPQLPEMDGVSSRSAGLAMFDLSFFYHFNGGESRAATFLAVKDTAALNVTALALLTGQAVRGRFQDEEFLKTVCADFLFAACGIQNPGLSAKLAMLAQRHHDWSRFFRGFQPYLDTVFLQQTAVKFAEWMNCLLYNHPRAKGQIKSAAYETRGKGTVQQPCK